MKVVPCKHCHGTGEMIEDELIIPEDPRIQQWFDEFWKAYPRKLAKAHAFKTWKRVVGLEATKNLIMVAIRAAMPRWELLIQQGRREFIPHAATWLSRHRWEDEVEPVTPQPLTGHALFLARRAIELREYRERNGHDSGNKSAQDEVL